MPFTHQYITTTGDVNLCCVADYANNLGRVTDLRTAWNSTELRAVRERMLADKPEPRCTLCYAQGEGSDRVSHNTRYAKSHADLELNARTGNSTDVPLWMDLRPGRLCNLKCRMCFSDVSSAIHDELVAHPELADLIGDTPRTITDWLEDPEAFSSVTRWVHHIGVLKLAGGEPLFMPGVLRLLKYCVDNNLTGIYLDITTNGTRLQGKTFRLLDNFKYMDIQFSMCGTGYTNDYIRTGADWQQLVQAYKAYTARVNTRVHIMATVQLYNIFTLHELVKFWSAHAQGNIVFNLVNYPQDLSIDLLDREGRELALSTLAGSEKFFSTGSRLAHVIERLHSKEPDNVDELRKQWVKRTQALDGIRGTDVKLIHPMLGKYCKDWA
mgnify:FL=1